MTSDAVVELAFLKQAQRLPCQTCGGSKAVEVQVGTGEAPCHRCRDENGVSTGLSPIALLLTRKCPGPTFKDDGLCVEGKLRGYNLRPAKVGIDCPLCGGTSRVPLHKSEEQLRVLLMHTETLGIVTMFYPPVPAFGEPSDDGYIPPEGWRVVVANRWPGKKFEGKTPEEALAALIVKVYEKTQEREGHNDLQ